MVTAVVRVDASGSAPPVSDPASGSAVAFDVHPGIHQVTVTGAQPGVRLVLLDADGAEQAVGHVDLLGSLLFRSVPAGTYTVADAAGSESAAVDVIVPDDVPDASLYTSQRLGPGSGNGPDLVAGQSWFGYIETRDGTSLSAWVSLPGDVADGPYPTLVEYSGYGPSNPDSTGYAQLINALGYAYVGVNIRGSGCSGGSFYYFDEPQLYDGYDVIEAVAAQPWVAGHRVGMTGISYPGISQLFVAQTQPPSLVAITPFSVIDDSYRAVLYPGGILNSGFGVAWLDQRLRENGFRGQAWSVDRIESGDAVCAANQNLRLQTPQLVDVIGEADTYVPEIYDPVAPRLFVDRIDVPVLLSGAWQDEQTGSHFATMLQNFTGTEHFYATLANGLHTESIGASSFARMVEFLDLYVAERVPSLDAARAIAPVLAGSIFGTDQIELPPDRFTGMTYDEALAAFEADAPVLLNLEEGAADGAVPGTPMPRFSVGLDAWPPPENSARRWYLGDGVLVDEPPTAAAGDPGTTLSYVADHTALPATFFSAVGNPDGVWAFDVDYDWQEPPAGTAASFVSEPFAADTILTGSGSVDLWIQADADDTDLEVTVSEVRPDGEEVMIQSGWLRASRRALDEDASTELLPVQTHLADDVAPLPPGEWTPLRVEVFPFAHPVRAGSRLRLTIDAPGGNRAEWAFVTINDGEAVQIAFDAEHPSSLVLGTIDPAAVGVEIPSGYPGCTLRGQPCREH
jgi:predicted acyl esterase